MYVVYLSGNVSCNCQGNVVWCVLLLSGVCCITVQGISCNCSEYTNSNIWIISVAGCRLMLTLAMERNLFVILCLVWFVSTPWRKRPGHNTNKLCLN